jgi:nicotinamidase-related amidase
MAGEERDLALRVINGAIMLFRERNLPVVRVYHTDPQRGPKPGSEGFQFPPSILVRADDPMVVKNFPSAFKHTELDSMLHEMGCDSVFLCGLSAVGCVLATYYGAKDLDYNVFMIKDAIMSHNTSYTTVVEEAFDTISYGALKFLLEYARY